MRFSATVRSPARLASSRRLTPIRPAGRCLERGVLRLAILPLLLVLPVLAQDNPDVARGFSAEKVYQFGEVDSVNLFNGNLTLAVPLGPGYTANGNLSYSLTLTYNSNLWRFETRQWKNYTGGGNFHYVTSDVAYLDPNYNASPGWRLSLGDLLDAADPDNPGYLFSYIGEDGAQHAFYDTLHDGEPSTSGVWYSRDGSYLRLRRIGGGNEFVVEFPDGSRRSFHRPVANWTSKFRIQWIEDAFGNRLTVTEVDPLHWELGDDHRTHHVYFDNRSIDGRTMRLVDRLELGKFGGGHATYQFNYVPLTIDESCHDTDDFDMVDDEDGVLTPPERDIYVLSDVDLPDGSSWSMPSYYTTCAAGSGSGYSEAENQPGVLKKLVLPTLGAYEWTYQDYIFPARVVGGPQGAGTLSEVRSTGVRRKRMLNATGGCFQFGEVGCEWRYTPQQNWGAFEHTTVVTRPNGDETKHYFDTHFRGDSTTWSGWEYGLPFTTQQSDGAGRYLSQEIYDGTVAAGTKKRSIYLRYERDRIAQYAVLPDEFDNLNRRVASRKTVYHDDASRYRTTDSSDFDGLGHYRTATTSSTIPGGATRTATTAYNAGRGSYTVNTANNTVSGGYLPWSSASPWVLGTFTERRQSEGSATAVQQACFDAATGALQRERIQQATSPGADDVVRVLTRDGDGNVTLEQWFGGDVQSVGTANLCSLALPGDRYRKANEYEYGTLTSSRWLTGSGVHGLWTYRGTVDQSTGLPVVVTGVDDLTVTLDYDDSGRLVSENPETGQGARTVYTYSPATSSAALANVLIQRRTNSGQVNLTQQRVTFDDFGRPWRESRLEPSGQWSHVDTVTNALGWRHSVSERMTGWPSKATVYKEFDPFGRPGRIEPPDDPDHRVLLWYAGDREVTRSYRVCSATAGCSAEPPPPCSGDLSLSNHAVTGVETETSCAGIEAGPAYHVASTGNLTLQAATQVVLNNGFSVANGGRLSVGIDPSLGGGDNSPESSFQTVERYDQHGRLYQVGEPSGSAGATVWTTYSYDVGNRLSRAYTAYGAAQNRYFTYDHRGFLTSEQHPEKGSFGNGTVSYSLYDPLGNPGRKQDGPYDLRYAYDRAGRLTNVDEVDAAVGWRPLKVFEFATANAGTDLRQGKLWRADRFNYVTLGGTPFTVQVRETYAYAGRGGAVSRRDTQMWVNGAAAESFTQGFAWRDLGTLLQLDYPECTHAGCASPSPRRVRFHYHGNDHGALENVEDVTQGSWYATGISYHPNGLYSQVAHGNGVTDVQWIEASAMARPARIYTSGASSNWDSGIYRYDGAGNIEAIGGSTYSYDGVNRLTRANTNLAPTGTGTIYSRTYSYDAFANLTAITALSGQPGRAIPVDSATNRLTGATHDAAGNVTSWNFTAFEYDALGMIEKRIDSGGGERAFVYTADDERFWSYHSSGSHWTLRDLDGKVLRDYRSDQNGWSVERDYVYRDGQLLAAAQGGTTYHYHLDHLGTPRLITDQTGSQVAYHVYHPYGEEATAWNQDDEVMKFTGHERDFYDAGPGDDLDYHHARYCNPQLGRYLGVDRLPRQSRAKRRPQLWNQYSYVAGNPLVYVDPRGLYLVVPGAKTVEEAQEEVAAFQEALLEIGETEAAESIQAEVVDGEVRVKAGREDLSESLTTTGRLIGALISSEQKITVEITSQDLSGFGGATTMSVGPKSEGYPIQLQLNPAQIAETRVPGIFTGGPFAGKAGPIGVSLGTALVHESGHAAGYLEKGRRAATNADALFYENQHRKLLTTTWTQTQRTRH